ncbi:MAG: hypothetical protein ACI86H_000843 [bacterium]|jgi:uncharacterized protein YfaS (alpha-2-macroglobulin family)
MEQKNNYLTNAICLIISLLFFTISIQANAAPRKNQVIPESFLRGYDPITIFFKKNIGKSRVGSEAKPERFLQIRPKTQGEYRWVDPYTLQFLPTDAWKPLRKYKVQVYQHRRSYTLNTLMTAPTSLIPSNGSQNLNPIKNITLNFKTSMPVQYLKQILQFEIQSTSEISKSNQIQLSTSDFTIKALEQLSASANFQYQINFKKPISYGKKLTLKIRLSVSSNQQTDAIAQYLWKTKPVFRLVKVGNNSKQHSISATGSTFTPEQSLNQQDSGKIFLEFNDNLGQFSIEAVKQLIQFKPTVKDLKYQISSNRVYLTFKSKREKLYQLNLKHTNRVYDQVGRPLASFKKSVVYLFSPPANPYLKWKKSQGILEQYGPQRLELEGRGYKKVDLRIYKINPFDRNFWPFSQSIVTINESTRPPGPGEEPPFAKQLAKHVKLLSTPIVSKLVSLPTAGKKSSLRFGLNLQKHFATISGKKKPGTYLVGIRKIGSNKIREYVRVQVTDLALSVVEERGATNFVVTSLKTGMPVRGATIKVDGTHYKDRDKTKWKQIISGTTNREGQYRFIHEKIRANVYRVSVKNGDDTLIIDPNYPPPYYMNNHWYGSYNKWLNWFQYTPKKKEGAVIQKAHVFTERPIYRPNEDIHIKGYFRAIRNGIISKQYKRKSGADGAKLVIYDPRGKKINHYMSLNRYGSFYLKLKTKSFPTGRYRVYFRYDGTSYGSTTFRIESYRVPKFEVQVNGPDKVPLDRPFKMLLTADYYAGGRVIGERVRWRVTQSAHSFYAPYYKGFLFSSNSRFSTSSSTTSASAIEKRMRTDKQGAATLSIDPSLGLGGQPRKYTVEATVTGADSQSVTTTKKVIALPPFMLGLKVKRFYSKIGTVNPKFLVINHLGKPLAGKQFRLRFYQRQWHSYLLENDFTTGQSKYVTNIVDKNILTKTITSQKKIFSYPLPVKESGVYVVEITSKDKLGRLQKVYADFYVAGKTPVTWKRPKSNIFRTSLSKRAYNPGDTAKILLKSPFQKARALAIIERPTGNQYKWIDIRNGQGTLDVKLTNQMVPRMPVHFLLMRGRIGNQKIRSFKHDRAKPITMANTTWIEVKPRNNKLKIKLKHKKVQLPGSTLTLDIKLTDADNRRVNGEVTLWLVDRAVLALGDGKLRDPLKRFLRGVSATIRIRGTRNLVVGEIFTEEISGGDGADDESMSGASSKARMKKKSIFSDVTVRKNFKTVAYYKPNLVARKGFIRIKIPLPENLTDFSIRAVGTDGKARFGKAESMVSIRLPIIVQSALPRFVRTGDQFFAGGVGRVVEGAGGSGRTEIQATGITIQGKKSRKVKWQKGKAKVLYFPMKVTKSASTGTTENFVKVKMAVIREFDQAKDAFEIKLPVKPDRFPDHISKFYKLKGGQTISIPWPKNGYRAGSLTHSLLVTREAAIVKVFAGLDYLAHYQHACTEQRISSLLPELVLNEPLKKLGRKTRIKWLKHKVDLTLKYLEKVQKPSGLFSYWPTSEGYVSLTAWVVEFLIEAKRQNFAVKTGMYSKAIRALRSALRSNSSYLLSGYKFYERTEALHALAKAGHLERGYAQELLGRAHLEDYHSEAKILYTSMQKRLGSNQKHLQVLKDLEKGLIFQLFQGNKRFTGIRYRNSSYWDSLIQSSEAKTMASIMKAMYQAKPNGKNTKILIDEIVRMAGKNGWGSTNANASVILALRDLLNDDREGTGFGVVSHTGKVKSNWDLANKAFVLKKVTQAGTKLSYTKGAKFPVHAWVNMRYLSKKSGVYTKSKQAGFVVQEELLIFRDLKAAPEKAKLEAGKTITIPKETIIETHVQVVNPEKRSFVAIRVPFAAGFEPMNPNLATSPPEAKPRGTFTRKPDYALYEDDQVTFYFDLLPKGNYHFYFRLKSSFEGSFVHPAAKAEMMYKEATYGNTDGARIKITAK